MTTICDLEGKVLENFKVMTIEYGGNARTIKAPIETGQQSLDNKVNDPSTVNVTGYVEVSDKETQEAIIKMKNCVEFKFLTVIDEDKSVYPLIMESFRKRRDPKTVDLYEYTLVYSEAMLIQSGKGSGKPANPQHSGAVSSGRINS